MVDKQRNLKRCQSANWGLVTALPAPLPDILLLIIRVLVPTIAFLFARHYSCSTLVCQRPARGKGRAQQTFKLS